MNKKIKILFLICSICLSATACKPTTAITEEAKKTYKEQIDSIDMESDTLTLDLSNKIRIDAVITPESKYKNGLGIYEFEKAGIFLETTEFIDRLNQYYGREEVTYEDSIDYLLEVTSEDEDLPESYKVGVPAGGSSADYSISKDYAPFITGLFRSEYPIYFAQADPVAEQIAKIMQLFGDQFQNISEENARYIILKDEEDYQKMEQIYKKINLKHDGSYNEGEDRLYNLCLSIGGFDSLEKKSVYGFECFEAIGKEKIPLINATNPSYKNLNQKVVPETSDEMYNAEVWTGTQNVVYAAFDGDGELKSLYLCKDIKVNDVPEKVEKIINLRQAAEIVYEKLKHSKVQIVVYSMQLYYTGVVIEENEGLEDYIYPVWKVDYYDSGSQSAGLMYINAVTGKEFME